MTTITQSIRNYLEPYWGDDFKLPDESVIKAIEEEIFKTNNIEYEINRYYDSAADDIIYHVFSWIENGKLKTFDLLIENKLPMIDE